MNVGTSKVEPTWFSHIGIAPPIDDVREELECSYAEFEYSVESIGTLSLYPSNPVESFVLFVIFWCRMR